VEGNTLTIGGEFALESAEDEQVRQSELPRGRFQRTLHFAAELDASQAEATVANGVLTLRVAKAESAKTKRIEVKAS
jgi:HSP20 family protein